MKKGSNTNFYDVAIPRAMSNASTPLKVAHFIVEILDSIIHYKTTPREAVHNKRYLSDFIYLYFLTANTRKTQEFTNKNKEKDDVYVLHEDSHDESMDNNTHKKKHIEQTETYNEEDLGQSGDLSFNKSIEFEDEKIGDDEEMIDQSGDISFNESIDAENEKMGDDDDDDNEEMIVPSGDISFNKSIDAENEEIGDDDNKEMIVPSGDISFNKSIDAENEEMGDDDNEEMIVPSGDISFNKSINHEDDDLIDHVSDSYEEDRDSFNRYDIDEKNEYDITGDKNEEITSEYYFSDIKKYSLWYILKLTLAKLNGEFNFAKGYWTDNNKSLRIYYKDKQSLVFEFDLTILLRHINNLKFKDWINDRVTQKITERVFYVLEEMTKIKFEKEYDIFYSSKNLGDLYKETTNIEGQNEFAYNKKNNFSSFLDNECDTENDRYSVSMVFNALDVKNTEILREKLDGDPKRILPRLGHLLNNIWGHINEDFFDTNLSSSLSLESPTNIRIRIETSDFTSYSDISGDWEAVDTLKVIKKRISKLLVAKGLPFSKYREFKLSFKHGTDPNNELFSFILITVGQIDKKILKQTIKEETSLLAYMRKDIFSDKQYNTSEIERYLIIIRGIERNIEKEESKNKFDIPTPIYFVTFLSDERTRKTLTKYIYNRCSIKRKVLDKELMILLGIEDNDDQGCIITIRIQQYDEELYKKYESNFAMSLSKLYAHNTLVTTNSTVLPEEEEEEDEGYSSEDDMFFLENKDLKVDSHKKNEEVGYFEREQIDNIKDIFFKSLLVFLEKQKSSMFKEFDRVLLEGYGGEGKQHCFYFIDPITHKPAMYKIHFSFSKKDLFFDKNNEDFLVVSFLVDHNLKEHEQFEEVYEKYLKYRTFFGPDKINAKNSTDKHSRELFGQYWGERFNENVIKTNKEVSSIKDANTSICIILLAFIYINNLVTSRKTEKQTPIDFTITLETFLEVVGINPSPVYYMWLDELIIMVTRKIGEKEPDAKSKRIDFLHFLFATHTDFSGDTISKMFVSYQRFIGTDTNDHQTDYRLFKEALENIEKETTKDEIVDYDKLIPIFKKNCLPFIKGTSAEIFIDRVSCLLDEDLKELTIDVEIEYNDSDTTNENKDDGDNLHEKEKIVKELDKQIKIKEFKEKEQVIEINIQEEHENHYYKNKLEPRRDFISYNYWPEEMPRLIEDFILLYLHIYKLDPVYCIRHGFEMFQVLFDQYLKNRGIYCFDTSISDNPRMFNALKYLVYYTIKTRDISRECKTLYKTNANQKHKTVEQEIDDYMSVNKNDLHLEKPFCDDINTNVSRFLERYETDSRKKTRGISLMILELLNGSIQKFKEQVDNQRKSRTKNPILVEKQRSLINLEMEQYKVFLEIFDAAKTLESQSYPIKLFFVDKEESRKRELRQQSRSVIAIILVCKFIILNKGDTNKIDKKKFLSYLFWSMSNQKARIDYDVGLFSTLMLNEFLMAMEFVKKECIQYNVFFGITEYYLLKECEFLLNKDGIEDSIEIREITRSELNEAEKKYFSKLLGIEKNKNIYKLLLFKDGINSGYSNEFTNGNKRKKYSAEDEDSEENPEENKFVDKKEEVKTIVKDIRKLLYISCLVIHKQCLVGDYLVEDENTSKKRKDLDHKEDHNKKSRIATDKNHTKTNKKNSKSKNFQKLDLYHTLSKFNTHRLFEIYRKYFN